ncbi:glutathione S-transferase T3-like [Castanea sativa]|uniref:glutathione S-transferase T3-like n=1 Tax=Castanea sativa TaxID=21020 RepID=UPI003F64F332
MDSQNPFLLDILEGNEQGFESFDSSILMSTPHSDVNVHQSPPQVEMGQSIPPIAKKSTTKRRGQRGINFTIDEDVKLVSAWLNVSLDAVTSTDQKHTTFWERIWSTFHNDKKFNRSKDSLTSRWSIIQKETNKFCGCLAQIENRNQSGKTEHDKIEDAKTLYLNNSKNAFQLEHCWRILKNEAKWLILRENLNARKRKPATQSSRTFASSIDLDEDNDEMNSGETLERPIGKKAEKEKLKKRKNCDDVVPILSSKLDEIKEEKRRMHEEKKESMRIALEERRELMCIASEERRELIRLKEEKNEVEKRKIEDEIMMKDTRTMDPEQQEYIRLRRLEILDRLKSKFPS